jgi:hypothetical protein
MRPSLGSGSPGKQNRDRVLSRRFLGTVAALERRERWNAARVGDPASRGGRPPYESDFRLPGRCARKDSLPPPASLSADQRSERWDLRTLRRFNFDSTVRPQSRFHSIVATKAASCSSTRATPRSWQTCCECTIRCWQESGWKTDRQRCSSSTCAGSPKRREPSPPLAPRAEKLRHGDSQERRGGGSIPTGGDTHEALRGSSAALVRLN